MIICTDEFIRVIKYSFLHEVRLAIAVKNAYYLQKLVNDLKKLSKSDLLVLCITDESGENIIERCGEFHLEIWFKDLVDEYTKKDIIKGAPVFNNDRVGSNFNDIVKESSPNK